MLKEIKKELLIIKQSLMVYMIITMKVHKKWCCWKLKRRVKTTKVAKHYYNNINKKRKRKQSL